MNKQSIIRFGRYRPPWFALFSLYSAVSVYRPVRCQWNRMSPPQSRASPPTEPSAVSTAACLFLNASCFTLSEFATNTANPLLCVSIIASRIFDCNKRISPSCKQISLFCLADRVIRAKDVIIRADAKAGGSKHAKR